MNQSINTDSKNSKEPQQKYRLGTVSIKILGGLNRFYRRLTSPSASIMAQNIQLFGPRGGFLTHQWIKVQVIVMKSMQYTVQFCQRSFLFSRLAGISIQFQISIPPHFLHIGVVYFNYLSTKIVCSSFPLDLFFFFFFFSGQQWIHVRIEEHVYLVISS